MIGNLIKARMAAGKSGVGEATFAQGRTPDGRLTSVRESIPGPGGGKSLLGDHAEMRVMGDLWRMTFRPFSIWTPMLTQGLHGLSETSGPSFSFGSANTKTLCIEK
jgi:hypothetical protein